MVRELEKPKQKFPETAPAANPVFFRTYSRRKEGERETWEEVCQRTIGGLSKLGKLTSEETELLYKMMRPLKSLPSGRWLWVGGTEWIEQQKNFSGSYNCTSTNVKDWRAFGLMMDLAMMGCGTGAVLEPQYIEQLPPIRNTLEVKIQGEIGSTPANERREETEVQIEGNRVYIHVGDSRQGWVKSYQTLLELSTDERFSGTVEVIIDLSNIRPAGEPLKGFGGVANPVKLESLYSRCAALLNKAVGRQLNSVECCILIDEAAVTIVAGNIRRSAGMRQGASTDEFFAVAKDNLWQQDAEGNWRIDPERDALRMANHSRVFHTKPTEQECIEATRKQYYSGEGAIQWAGEAIARANNDLLTTSEGKLDFLHAYNRGEIKQWFQKHYPDMSSSELDHRLARFGLNPCHSGDTLVSTDRGLVAIKDLIGQHFKALVDLRSVGLDGVKLTDAIAFPTGTKEVHTITLNNGLKLKCTADHKHLTNTGWVATKDLTSHHTIYIQKGEGSFGKGTITSLQAQMLGWLYGDGSIYQQKQGLDAVFYINQNEYPTVFPVLAEAVESLTNYNHQPSLVKGIYTFHSGAPQMKAFFAQLGIKNKDALPTEFLSQSKEVIIGFLQGLFCADGCVSVKARHIELRNRSRELLQQVQLLLLNLGIKSSLRIKQKPGAKGVPYTLKDGTKKVSENRGSWRILVYSGDGARKFLEQIGFPLVPEKQERLEQLATRKPSRTYSPAVISEWYTSKVEKIEEYGEETVYDLHVPLTHSFIANGCITHNCGEIIGSEFHCNLAEVHLNQLNPHDEKEQEEAFSAGALSVATLLNHEFTEPRYRYSRELDPIVGVSFTGLFDFFVNAFGVEWLRWWQEGRPDTPQGIEFKEQEKEYLTRWRDTVHRVVWEYCDKHGLKRPNRATCVQPSGTKSLLTNASPGWHPPFGLHWIRRITFAKEDPVALACLDYGYPIIPGQSDKDENGNLLNDPFDERVKEWLVEIPTEVPWANLPGADEISIDNFTALTVFDFYMQVQKHWTTHNTSSTILFTEEEIEPLGKRIYETIRDDEGYISSALLAKFDAPFPRLPFERISKEKYEQFQAEVEQRRKSSDFAELVNYQLSQSNLPETGPQDAACSGLSCEMKGNEPLQQ